MMTRSTECPECPKYAESPCCVKSELRRLGITQSEAARIIGKSIPMVSMVLNGHAKSQPVLHALWRLILARSNGGTITTQPDVTAPATS